MRATATALLLALGAAPALGHTWIEQLRNVNAQGDYVGEYGYPRGMFGKTDPGYDGFKMNWQVPQTSEKSFPFISSNSSACHTSQRKQQQSQEKYPRLQATPGGFLALRYMENGHITKSDIRVGKPEKGGTVFVYGTTQPKEDEKLADILQWTQDGQGGDKRGKIIGMNNYDDGRCYEVSDAAVSQERQKEFPNYAMGQAQGGPGGMPLFCETNVALPKDAESGKPYTLYWVWQWNTIPKKDPGLPDGQDEYYTTCIDVDVVDAIKQDAKAEFALGQQDAMSVAVKDFAHRTAIITDAVSFEMGPVFSSKPTGTGGAPPAQSTLVTQPIPTLTKRPGDRPTGAPDAPSKAPDGDNIVRITVTERVTVTAPVAGPTGAARRAEHLARHNVRNLRGRWFSE